MKIFNYIINNKMRLYNQTQLNHNYLISVWNFYEAYSISLCITGQIDNNILKKNKLISQFISDSHNIDIYNKIHEYIKKDIRIINMAIEIIQQGEDESDFFGDKYQKGMIGISMYD